MPLIDLLCYHGVNASGLAVRPPAIAQASAYADSYTIETLCFASGEAGTDLRAGNARLAEALKSDARFRGWLTLSIHQTEASYELARQYLTRSLWVGSRFEQGSDADAILNAGGHELVNSLRRYGRPILLTVTTNGTLQSAIAAAREFTTLRFIIAPQTEALTTDCLPAIAQILNISLLPVAAFAERDVIAQAVACIGERRILWGSEWGRFHPAAALGMLKDCAITAAQRERFALRNAKDLLSA